MHLELEQRLGKGEREISICLSQNAKKKKLDKDQIETQQKLQFLKGRDDHTVGHAAKDQKISGGTGKVVEHRSKYKEVYPRRVEERREPGDGENERTFICIGKRKISHAKYRGVAQNLWGGYQVCTGKRGGRAAIFRKSTDGRAKGSIRKTGGGKKGSQTKNDRRAPPSMYALHYHSKVRRNPRSKNKGELVAPREKGPNVT